MNIFGCKKCSSFFDIDIVYDMFNKYGYKPILENWEFCPMCPKFEKWFKRQIKTEFYSEIRYALTGDINGLNVAAIMFLLGKEATIKRMNNYINFLKIIKK